ncbi:hypothetical protein BU15DRAFT_64786 [Melanogaster broomeanus]|nr:hypothetical protein BU15DRAFT_64786 [Melanogaster broomeanus]
MEAAGLPACCALKGMDGETCLLVIQDEPEFPNELIRVRRVTKKTSTSRLSSGIGGSWPRRAGGAEEKEKEQDAARRRRHRVTSGVRLVEFLSQDLDRGVVFLCGRPVFCELVLVDPMLSSSHLMTPSRPS